MEYIFLDVITCFFRFYVLSPSSDINPCYSLFFDRDHLRSNMAIRSGIICGPIWESFAVRDHLQSWDHLRTRTGRYHVLTPLQQSIRDLFDRHDLESTHNL